MCWPALELRGRGMSPVGMPRWPVLLAPRAPPETLRRVDGYKQPTKLSPPPELPAVLRFLEK
jgi:hypothetical protein